MLLYKDATVDNLLNCASVWSEASLLFSQLLCGGVNEACMTFSMTLGGWYPFQKSKQQIEPELQNHKPFSF